MKIIALNGSPRKGWNTHQMLEAFLEGARAADAETETELVHLFDLSYTGCRSCFACTAQCPSGALLQVGQEQTVGDVLQAVLADLAYYAHTGGGMTVSGGEPIMQPRFTRALLQAAHAEGVHTALETNGSFPWERYAPLVGSLDLVLLDYKATGAERSLALTGNDESRG